MATANERLADESIHHAIDLSGYSNGVVRRILALLNRTDADLFAQLSARLDTMDPESFTVERLESLLISVRQLNKAVYERVGLELADELRGLAGTEASYQHELIRSVVPAQLQVASVSAEQAYAAAMARPFQGGLLREFSEALGENRMQRIRESLRIGYVQNKTVSQMVRELRGTRARGYSDGLIEIDRRHASSVVRTAISHLAATVRDGVYEANSDLISAVMWRATLDTRTSSECRARDGKRYTLGDRPKPIGHLIPWCGSRGCGPGRLHWNCRSTASPVLKSFKELGGEDIESFTPAQRASMDGGVPADLSYSDWLKRQSAARQDEVLGPVRGKLLRDGGIAPEGFATDNGKWLTLDQLRERNAAAFKRAGL